MRGLAEALKSYARAGGRVCPLPPHWSHLWGVLARLADEREIDRPPSPLVLVDWSASDREKVQRLADQIEWALGAGLLRELEQELRALPREAWLIR